MSTLAAAEGVGEIVDMQHHPFGNNYFATPECGGAPYSVAKRQCFEKRCSTPDIPPPSDCFSNASGIVAQHGKQEYEFNRLQACAKDFTVERGQAWYERYWTFVVCVEDRYVQGIGCARECAGAANFTSGETTYLLSCLESARGDASVAREARATIEHQGTPTVIVDGKQSSPYKALDDVCRAYTGAKPPGCSAHKVKEVDERQCA